MNQVIRKRIESLTPRERDVFELVAQGQPTKVIAKLLDISTKTVEVHRSRLMRKLGVQSVSQLAHVISFAVGQSPGMLPWHTPNPLADLLGGIGQAWHEPRATVN